MFFADHLSYENERDRLVSRIRQLETSLGGREDRQVRHEQEQMQHRIEELEELLRQEASINRRHEEWEEQAHTYNCELYAQLTRERSLRLHREMESTLRHRRAERETLPALEYETSSV